MTDIRWPKPPFMCRTREGLRVIVYHCCVPDDRPHEAKRLYGVVDSGGLWYVFAEEWNIDGTWRLGRSGDPHMTLDPATAVRLVPETEEKPDDPLRAVWNTTQNA